MMENNSENSNFIKTIIDDDLRNGKIENLIVTRFPPEPNGYLHIGHAKSICLNFGVAADYSGKCHLRFDDTNPEKESIEFSESIEKSIKWLGFDYGENLFHSSDYFEKLYNFAVELIEKELAYVCELSAEEMRKYRGTLQVPGKNSPFRDRAKTENLKLFKEMKEGVYPDGKYMLRVKIDMASPNLNMRDPVIYRIKKIPHHRTGRDWCIFPMYDFTHCLSDALEGITHSLCTLEFEDHRPLYDWFIQNVNSPCHPQQIEFARLNLEYTVMSKRKLQELVSKGVVDGWDDPRLPTLVGMKRRGYTAQSIKDFCKFIGVGKKETSIDMTIIEDCLRRDLDKIAMRYMAVIRPLEIVIDNYPEDKIEYIEVANHPKNPDMGTRKLHFSKKIYIERSDFMEDPPQKYFRLRPGGEVRLRNAYVLSFESLERDEKGEIIRLHCNYDDRTLGGITPKGKKKVKGIIHWVPVDKSIDATVMNYDRLFKVPNPLANKEVNYLDYINNESLSIEESVKIEPSFSQEQENPFQFERLGYYCLDKSSSSDNLIINRSVSLRDSWKK